MTGPSLRSRRVALAVCGGIAAYKAVEVLRLLQDAGAEVRVLMTPEARQFVGPLTFEALSGHPVLSDWLEPGPGGEAHIQLSEWAEVLVIAPATANTIAKLALGRADDLVSGTALATRAPLLLAPAMNDLMLSHPQTEEHIATLSARGATVVAPSTGRLASGKIGAGRLAAPERIVAAVEAALLGRRTLGGVRVVVSAGGTREAIDPVRYLSNFSSGKMGQALARVAQARGAEVTLVTTVPAQLEGITEVPVSTAEEMLAAMQRAAQGADTIVMAAAVADYRPGQVARDKIKRRDAPLELTLVPNVDILDALATAPGVLRVGFAAETDSLIERARDKLTAKRLDLIVANPIGVDGQGLGSDYNAATILSLAGVVAEIPRQTKWQVANQIWDAIEAARASRR
ncbi:MAG TPA: bifunctional phosphopantothenoylcysteine decarboxylase/phosphopantothenate--cysteine ligase CoaBC [Candidatus Limnocylindrales bacterium]|nr:bifunctional phosphopantothenoylcysteine decarboxylase/phosphopantothenate--cysteine ligase CoaBC [Candidatus Limnocylindrales bacterium]